ncbi:MAG: ABC-type transporter, integral rane subunit [Marmoricola sp.]|nr:ABC-type transporter, integral rane subunit [Marmoricola sp.]
MSARNGADRHRRVVWGFLLLLLALLTLLVVTPQLLTSTSPVDSTGPGLVGPSADHWFGTDQLGRDIYARTVYGARPVVLASLCGIAIAAIAGTAAGVVGGIAPGWLSSLVMRLIDIVLALPALLIALMVVAILGTGTTSVVVAVGFAYAPAFARVIYGSVRRLRTADYIAAAQTFGASPVHNVFRHLLPNLATEVVVLISSSIGWAILTAGTLSFLGFGVSLPRPDWGADLAAGGQYLETAWWISTFPGLAITATILLSNYLGDFVSDALDPQRSLKRTRATAGVLP